MFHGVPVFLVLVQAALGRFRGIEIDLMGRRSHLRLPWGGRVVRYQGVSRF